MAITTNMYHYVLILPVLLIIRLIVRWILALRFQFKFGRIGIFSVSDIGYRQRTHFSHELWSVSVGKIKLRIKSATSQASTAWITLHVETVQVRVHDLERLLHPPPKRRSTLNRRLSQVGDSLRQPWWYSLAIVKSLFKMTSALPAQFVMAGLANYIDVQISDLTVDAGSYGALHISHIHFCSVLFAAMGLQAPLPQQSGPETYEAVSLHSRRQRHSLKRAGHLFREKFFEIMVQLGPVRLNESAVTLPEGGRMAISCHLSAGCLTLKDVDTSLRVNDMEVDLAQMAHLLHLWPRKKHHAYKSKHNNTHQPNTLQLLHSIKLSIRTLGLRSPQHGVFLLMVLHDICATATSESRFYECDITLKETVCRLLDASPGLETASTEFMSMTDARLSAKVPHTLLLGGPVLRSKKFALSLPDTNADIDPNKSTVSIEAGATGPTVKLDLLQQPLWKRWLQRQHDPKPETGHQNTQKTARLPRIDMHMELDSPSIVCCTREVEDVLWKTGMTGKINTATTLTLDISAEYTAQTALSRSSPSSPVAASPTSPSFQQEHDDTDVSLTAGLRRRPHTRPWMNLFRRNWRTSEHAATLERKQIVEWVYVAAAKMAWHDVSLQIIPKEGQVNLTEKPLLSFDSIKLIAQAQLQVNTQEKEDYCVVLDMYNRRIDAELSVERPTLNATAKCSNRTAVEFWLVDVVQPWSGLRGQIKSENKPVKEIAPYYEKFQWLKHAKLGFSIVELILVMDSADPAIRRTRKPPPGYLDNAPNDDINTTFTATAYHISLGFTGAAVSGTRSRHRNNLGHLNNTPGDEDMRIHTGDTMANSLSRLGSIKGSLQDVVGKSTTHIKSVKSQTTWDSTEQVMLWISHVNSMTDILAEEDDFALTTEVVVRKSGVRYSIANLYSAILIAFSLKKMLHRLPWNKTTTPVNQPDRPPKKVSVLRKVQLQLNRTDVHIALGSDTSLYLRMDGLRTEWRDQTGRRDEIPPIAIRNFTLFGVAPADPAMWDMLFEADAVHLTVEKDIDFKSGQFIKANRLTASKLFLRIPHQFVMADIADNLVNHLKCVKLLKARLGALLPYLRLVPTEKNDPVHVPPLRLQCDTLMLQVEDDPFEARLRTIFRTGLQEQTVRMAYQAQLEVAAKDEDEASVHQAWAKLLDHHSNAWKKRINEAIKKEEYDFDELRRSDYRLLDLDIPHDAQSEGTDERATLFCIDVIPLPRFPPLFSITVLSVVLDMTEPESSLGDARKFMHDLGKGLPYDTAFSLLVPFHVNLSAGESWAQVRDYPIPMLHIPSAKSVTSGQGANTAWSLSGDYVFGDELGDLDATRCVAVPVIGTYEINVLRTSSPPKFYSTVAIEVHGQSLTSICWSVSYQPAIQDLTRVLEAFTRPPIDPSPKIGFWDKLRLMIHTRTTISFVGGGDFAFVMKGTRDPYDMSDRAFGLAKLWRKDVQCLLGHENAEGEFIQIISQDYAFGVPDLVHGGYAAPYLLPAMKSKRTRMASASFEGNQQELRFLKVALKFSGGIRMGVGCHLERICTSGCADCHGRFQCRLLHFYPHYGIKFKTPEAVQALGGQGAEYDAYAGFRSDFIHLSISIMKLTDKKQGLKSESTLMNSMHLTPGFIDHFVAWFRLFGGALGYPMRNGPLFPKLDDRPTKKFGKHMRTMKYKVEISPLSLGYFYKDDNTMDDDLFMYEVGPSVGLKALVSSFSIDIHQRREVVNVDTHTLDQKRLKANWPVHEAEVQLRNVDLRAVTASYTGEGSAADELAKVPISISIDDEDEPSRTWAGELEDPDDPRDDETSKWVDLDDFVELHIVTPNLTPRVQVLPFAFSPCIYYLKQTSREDLERHRHLHKTHDCIIGTAIGTRDMQIALLQERSASIDVQIRKHQHRLGKLRSECPDESAASDAIVEKTEILFEKRNLLKQYLKELSSQPMPGTMNKGSLDEHGKEFSYSDSTIFGRDSLARWEELMGYFKARYIIHNPQIIWNNQVRNIVYLFLELQTHRRSLSYYMLPRAVKLLRDLKDTHLSKDDQLNLDKDDGGLDSAMAQDLINKLLMEQDTNLYAPNETEQRVDDSDTCSSLGVSSSDTVNNPDMHVNSIPDGYDIKTSYLVDLLNPQISLQSDCDPDSLVIMSNERMQVKGLSIMDSKDPDIEMGLVKDRTIVSFDNAQFFVAKKEQFDSVDLLLDNHYGARENDHWLTWIPPEMLISEQRHDKFQRVGDRMAATIQVDKYNPLRIKAHPSKYSQYHPLEERSDSVQLNFPKLALTTNAAQYNAIYEVIVDLLLYKEPAKKERLEKLREIVMAADRGNLRAAAEEITELQTTIRRLTQARDYYRQHLSDLTDDESEKYRRVREALSNTQEELYLGMEAIKLIQSNQRRDFHEPKTNLKFVFSAEKIIWEMLTDKDSPLCEWTVTNTTFSLVSKEDHSSTNTLEVDVLEVENKSSSPVFVDILRPFLDEKLPNVSRHKMLRCYFVSLAPVGGIPVVQHLELNLSPLKLQMTYEFGKALGSYFFPAEKRLQKASESTGTLTPSTLTMVSPSGSGTALEQDTASVHDHRRQASDSRSLFDTSSQSDDNSVKMVEIPSAGTRTAMETDGSIEFTQSFATLSTHTKKKQANKLKLHRHPTVDDFSVMKKRASSNRTFILVKIPGAKHCISYRGQKEKNIEDLREFAFQQPNLEYRNRTWSWYELVSTIKKDFMRATLLHNSTALLKEKLLIRRHPRNYKLVDAEDASQEEGEMRERHARSLYEMDKDYMTESDDNDDELHPDTLSLRSFAYDTEPNADTRHSFGLSWPRKRFGRKRPTAADHDQDHLHPSGDTFAEQDYTRSVSSVHAIEPRETARVGEELATRGKLLLGKSYNGPTRPVDLAHVEAPLSPRARSSRSKPMSIKSSSSSGSHGGKRSVR